MPPFHLVDAFTESPFAGNPAGVVVLDGPAPEVWMQQVAAEVKASETAFVHPEGPARDRWALRWFTPAVEVDLCGHATLATAHVLWATAAADGPLTFSTRSGDLHAREDGAWTWLDLPAWPVRDHPAPTELERALAGVPYTYLGRTGGASGEDDDQANDVVELEDERAVRELAPDLAAVAGLGSAGLIVTAAADGAGDLVSRYFAPNVGIDEDPVTGSAHSTLGPLWAQRLDRAELEARQLSARGGRLLLRVDGDRVLVAGHAVTTIVGEVIGP